MATVPAQPSVEETLAWEAERRDRAGAAALIAGLILFASFLVSTFAFGDSPDVVLTDGVRDLLGQPLPGGRKGLLTPSAMWFDDHAVSLIAATIASAVGTLLIVVVLGYLFHALQARRPQTSKFVLYAVLVGPILYGVGPLISVITVVVDAGDYVSNGVYSTVGAHDALRNGSGIATAQFLVAIGTLATAVAVVFVSLYAMQVGLLSRFLGILGCIVGVLLLFPLFGSPAIVESFWLFSLGLLFLGRVRLVPPAWAAGRAVAWPTQQQLRERTEHEERVAVRGGGGSASDAEDTDAAEAVEELDGGSVAVAEAPGPHPSSNKRKRKRR